MIIRLRNKKNNKYDEFFERLNKAAQEVVTKAKKGEK